MRLRKDGLRKDGLRRIIAAFMAVILLISTGGCGSKNGDGETSEAKQDGRVPVTAASRFKNVWRGDVSYADMEYEHYDITRFSEYTDAIYGFAENGGTSEELSDADFNLVDELYYVYTLSVLAELMRMSDPEDREIAGELLYAQELYETAWEEYWLAMRELAISDYGEMLEPLYHETVIQWFREYEPYTDEEEELLAYGEEDELVQEYYYLMAQEQQDWEAIGEIYVELVELRRNQAEILGYESYADYAYYSAYGKDYLPEDAVTVWEGVKTYFVPLLRKYGASAVEKVTALYYDDSLDCSPERILAVMEEILPDISTELYTAFRYMIDYGLYDISCDPDKANIGYTVKLYYYNEPFIFNAAHNAFYDYTDMFHEFGHFANGYYTQSDLLFGISDNDLCELQSQGLEMLFTHYYEDIFGSRYADAALNYVLLDMIYSVIDGALYDEFQQQVFAEEELNPGKVNEIYARLYQEYGYEPYEGYETEWMQISHNFDYPFYYISYCVSALGALEIYEMSRDSWDEAVDRYLTILAADPELYYYSTILEEAGFYDIFSADSYRSIAEALENTFDQTRDRIPKAGER